MSVLCTQVWWQSCVNSSVMHAHVQCNPVMPFCCACSVWCSCSDCYNTHNHNECAMGTPAGARGGCGLSSTLTCMPSGTHCAKPQSTRNVPAPHTHVPRSKLRNGSWISGTCPRTNAKEHTLCQAAVHKDCSTPCTHCGKPSNGCAAAPH